MKVDRGGENGRRPTFRAGRYVRPVSVPLRPHLASALAELALRELALAGFGETPGSSRSEAAIVALTPGADPFPPAVWAFLRSAARALHARFALDDTRRALEESRTRANAMFETTVDGVVMIDGRGRIETFNAGAERIFQYAADEVVGRRKSERRRIGQDLHDGLGQELTAIGLLLRSHGKALEREGHARAEEARRRVGLVEEADAHARGLARSLVPVELEQNELETALARLAERAASLYDTDVHAETTGTGPAEASALHADEPVLDRPGGRLQRCPARERRARPRRPRPGHRPPPPEDRGRWDRICRRPTGVRAHPLGQWRRGPRRSRLDHRAERPGTARPTDGLRDRAMGLRIMNYRARLAGGTLDVRPGAEGGTVVTCTVPLHGPGFHPSPPSAIGP